MTDRTLRPAKWLANFTVVTAVLAFAGWAASAYGLPALSATAVVAVYLYGLLSVVYLGRPTTDAARRAGGLAARLGKLKLAFLVTTTVLFTGWAGWVAAAGVNNYNIGAFLAVLAVTNIFAVVVDGRPDSPAVSDPGGGDRRFSDVSIRLVYTAQGPLFEVYIDGAQTTMGPGATAETVADHIDAEREITRQRLLGKSP